MTNVKKEYDVRHRRKILIMEEKTFHDRFDNTRFLFI